MSFTPQIAYPGRAPGASSAWESAGEAGLANAAIRCIWRRNELSVAALESGRTVALGAGVWPQVVLDCGRVIDLAALCTGPALTAVWRDEQTGLRLECSATLDDGANAVIQSLELTADGDIQIRELVFIDAALPGARQVGEVDGSVVVCGDIFMAVEHPLAKNTVDSGDRMRCSLPLECRLPAGQSRTYSSAIGVAPAGQLRRGFLYYLENRRIHPYRQFLHYNNWYDVRLERATQRITESECLETVQYFGRELVEKRGMKLDAFVWDDGWDDFNTLWDFHKGFPEGFRNLKAAAAEYGADQGVWMSPNGGYARAKEARLAYGRPLGFETNERGFAMAGPNYRAAFRKACLDMIREHGVLFFKFDGMGKVVAGISSGTSGELSNDIHAILELSRDLHREKPDLYISATAGTWASPFWLLYVDCIWRQGGDSGHHGKGDTRQQWITYRDMFSYERVVKAGPLYPLNSLMLHGILIGNRPGRAPAGMVLDEKSVADEIWSFFGSGTCLQELYVSPDVPTDSMLDCLAAAAGWARANEDVLLDTHWIGGNPGCGQVYGWASWQPGKGILVLRNPSETTQTFSTCLRAAFELPNAVTGTATRRSVYPPDTASAEELWGTDQARTITLAPFEVTVMEFKPQADPS